MQLHCMALGGIVTGIKSVRARRKATREQEEKERLARAQAALRAAEAELTESLARLSPGATFTSRLLGP